MKIHDLKIQSQHFKDVVSGIKKAEIRKNDRNFNAGDYLQLNEIDCEGEPTGEGVRTLITHILPGGAWGISQNYCVLSISLVAFTREYQLKPAPVAFSVTIGETQADTLERLFKELREKPSKEDQAALNKTMRLARGPNHPDAPENFCTLCCGHGEDEAGEICEGCGGWGHDDEVAR